MAFLFVDSLAQNNNRFVQIIGKILEMMLLSVGLISTLVVMKEAILPYSCELVFSSLLGFWSSIRCLLSSPPTIIIIVNVMVVLILASSAFYGRGEPDNHHHETTLLDVDVDVDHDHDLQIADYESHVPPPPPLLLPPPSRDVVEIPPPPPPPPPSIEVETTSLPPPSRDVVEIPPPPPPPTSTRIPIRNNTTSSSSKSREEKWKDVFIENEEEDTMDATWKAITGGGKQKAKKKHLKKSETWDRVVPPRRSAVQRLDSEEVLPTSPKWKELRKAETFNDAVSLMRRGGMIRSFPSMSLAELNQKVETFIKNFNNNMRLQRQQSHQRFLDKINQQRL